MTLEQFEVGFMRDMHPEREVDVWCSITAAWLDYRTLFRARLDETSSISPARRALETEFPKSRFRNWSCGTSKETCRMSFPLGQSSAADSPCLTPLQR